MSTGLIMFNVDGVLAKEPNDIKPLETVINELGDFEVKYLQQGIEMTPEQIEATFKPYGERA